MTRIDPEQREPKRRLLGVFDPGKPISEMTEQERNAFADLIAGRIEQARAEAQHGAAEDDDITRSGSPRSDGPQAEIDK